MHCAARSFMPPRSYNAVKKEKRQNDIRAMTSDKMFGYDMVKTPILSSAETRQKGTVVRTCDGCIIKTVLGGPGLVAHLLRSSESKQLETRRILKDDRCGPRQSRSQITSHEIKWHRR